MVARILLTILFLIQAYQVFPSTPQSLIPSEALQAEGKKDWQKAISIYLDLLLKNPNRIEFWLKLATLEYKLKNYNLAIDAYLHALSIQPNNATISKNLSEVYAEINKPKEALEYINRAVNLIPNDPNYLLARAQIANWNNEIAIALDSYKRLLALNDYQAMPISPLEILIKIAALENQLHDYPQAIKAYTQALKIQPNNPLIYQALSQLYASTNSPLEALQAINKALEFDPNNIEFLKSKALFANWLKNPKLALATYQKLLELSDNTALKLSKLDLYMQIGSLQNQLHHYPEAIKAFDKALQIDSHNASLYQALAQTYASKKEFPDALEAINKALQIEPKNLKYLESKAMIAASLKDSKLAIASYQEILKLSPANSKDNERIKKAITLLQNPLQEKTLSPLEQLIAKANNESILQHYEQAANIIKNAIKLKPNDANLYKKLSETYAMAKQAKAALDAINEAVKLAPTNIEFWRARAKLAAWANDLDKILESYEKILQLKPFDQDAMLNRAHTLAWQKKTDKSLRAYRDFLKRYPQDPEGWIQYAEALTWIQDYTDSFDALDHYKRLKGEDIKYLKTKARALAQSGRFYSALVINDSLLKKSPKDIYILTTEVTALHKNLQTYEAVNTLKKINQLDPNNAQVKSFNKNFLTPLRSNINLGADYTWASDTTRIEHIPIIKGQYFIRPDTSFLVQGFYERATAAKGSGFDTIDGDGSIFDENIMIGVSSQMPKLFNFTGLVGALKIQNKNDHIIYDTIVNTNTGEIGQLSFESLHNLYRPYLIPQSPRLISLQIMENRLGMVYQWQPFIQKYLNILVSHSDLSDSNGYWHKNFWPKARVYSSEHWQVTLGVDADFWNYKRTLSDGYYSPRFFQGYEGTIETYYGISENIGCSMSGGFGMQKDETFPHYFYEEDLAMQVFLGIFTDWQVKINSGFTLRKNPTNVYHSWSSSLVLVRRFG